MEEASFTPGRYKDGLTAYKRMYRKRVKLGLCVKCGEEIITDRLNRNLTKAKTCDKCLSKEKERIKKARETGFCITCRTSKQDIPTSTICSKCNRLRRELRDRRKAEVLQALGGRCTCTSTSCWHEGECIAIDERVLTVDHVDGGGNIHRKRRWVHYNWTLYLKAIRTKSHRLQLLCWNCHMLKDKFKRTYKCVKP